MRKKKEEKEEKEEGSQRAPFGDQRGSGRDGGDASRQSEAAGSSHPHRLFDRMHGSAQVPGPLEGHRAGLAVPVDVSVIIDVLFILSHAARKSGEVYKDLIAVGVVGGLAPLLWAPSATVRYKTCHLLGNLCRHDSKCVPFLVHSAGAVEGLMMCLEDNCHDKHEKRDASRKGARGERPNGPHDPMPFVEGNTETTIKFACLGIGNMAFHSCVAHAALRPAVYRLANLVRTSWNVKKHTLNTESASYRDMDESARPATPRIGCTWIERDPKLIINACGALSNLSLRSDLCVHELLRVRVVVILMDLSMYLVGNLWKNLGYDAPGGLGPPSAEASRSTRGASQRVDGPLRSAAATAADVIKVALVAVGTMAKKAFFVDQILTSVPKHKVQAMCMQFIQMSARSPFPERTMKSLTQGSRDAHRLLKLYPAAAIEEHEQ